MSLQAGHCTTCGALIWRTVTHGRTGAVDLTYPMPSSVYARVQVGHAVSPGIGYCAAHEPLIGDRGPDLPQGPSTVVAIEAAALRHAHWFSAQWGRHFAAWLRDYCELPDDVQATIFETWERDRSAAEAVHG